MITLFGMWKCASLFFITSLFPSSYAWFYGRPEPDAMTYGGVWPLPWNITYEKKQLSIDPDAFIWNSTNGACEIIDEALKRYQILAFPKHTPGDAVTPSDDVPVASSVTVSSKAGCTNDYPQSGMDESCKLFV